MDIKTIREKAREGLKGFCRVCHCCDGKACAGEVPGMGGLGTGSSFRANIEALQRIRFRMTALHDVKAPLTKVSLFKQELAMPILAAPMTGVSYNMGGRLTEEQFISEVLLGSRMAGTMGMCGDGADPTMYDSGLKAIKECGGKGIAIIKPRAQLEIIDRIKRAEDAGAIAVGIDIDGAGLITMALKGQPVGPKTPEELAELVSATTLPFVLKGIMTKMDALTAVKTGVSAVVVSNHGGRVLDHTPGTVEVLAEIVDAVKGKAVILVDGGIRSGSDVLKCLALGADAVLIGRPLVIGVFGGGKEGVSLILNTLKSELTQAMLLTGTKDVMNVSRFILA